MSKNSFNRSDDFAELKDENLKKVTGGGDDLESYLAGKGGKEEGNKEYFPKINPYELPQGGDCMDIQGTDGKGNVFPVCSDKPNQGIKPECASCPARNSKH